MNPPIIIHDRGDVMIFQAAEDAERYLEPWQTQMLEAFDSRGYLLRVTPRGNTVRIERAEDEPRHEQEVRKLVVDYLEFMGVSPRWLAKASLEELMHKALDYKIK